MFSTNVIIIPEVIAYTLSLQCPEQVLTRLIMKRYKYQLV